MRKTAAERRADEILRTQHEVKIPLAKGLDLTFEVNFVGPSFWMLSFRNDSAISISPGDAAALISAANGPQTYLSFSKRRLTLEEVEELREAATSKPGNHRP